MIRGVELGARLQGRPGGATVLAIFIIDDAVPVGVDVFDVAGFGVGLDDLAGFIPVVVDLVLAFEDAGLFDAAATTKLKKPPGGFFS